MVQKFEGPRASSSPFLTMMANGFRRSSSVKLNSCGKPIRTLGSFIAGLKKSFAGGVFGLDRSFLCGNNFQDTLGRRSLVSGSTSFDEM
jgi:hypothetical protein